MQNINLLMIFVTLLVLQNGLQEKTQKDKLYLSNSIHSFEYIPEENLCQVSIKQYKQNEELAPIKLFYKPKENGSYQFDDTRDTNATEILFFT